ncbi:MAG: hypothetical protein M3O34_05620 [Chloroflexota bacterium]|nr:hypothetical protein [Chloroflexota bacterium]
MAADTPFGRGDHEHGPPARVEPYLPASHAPVASFESTPTRFQSVAPPRRDALGVASGIVGLALKLTMLAILLALFVGLLGLIGVGGRSTAIVGEQVGAAFQRGVDSIGAAAHRVRDTFDPAHPPRDPLAQDTEIDELLRVGVGQDLAGSTTRTVTLASVQRREGAGSPDTAVYATLKSELRVPEETRVLGVTLRSTRDPREHHLYRGETFRIGNRLYKVNWVSVERQQAAIVAYRDQDRVTAPVKFAID